MRILGMMVVMMFLIRGLALAATVDLSDGWRGRRRYHQAG